MPSSLSFDPENVGSEIIAGFSPPPLAQPHNAVPNRLSRSAHLKMIHRLLQIVPLPLHIRLRAAGHVICGERAIVFHLSVPNSLSQRPPPPKKAAKSQIDCENSFASAFDGSRR